MVALALVGLLFLARNPLLKLAIQYRIETETGFPAEIGQVQLDLGSSTLRLVDFRISSGADFQRVPLLEMPELFIRVSPAKADGKTLSLAEVRLHLSAVNVVKNKQGQLNLAALRQRASKRHRDRSEPSSPAEFIAIERLSVTLGKVRYVDCADPSNNVEFNLGVVGQTFQHIESEQDLQNCLGTLLARIAWEQYLQHPGQFRSRLWQVLRETLL